MPNSRESGSKGTRRKKVSLSVENSDHSKELPKLKTIKGQLLGVEKMIEEKRYCTDILAQVRAARAGLLMVEASILETHLHNCVAETFQSGSSKKAKAKIDEIISLFRQSSTKGVRL